MIEVEGLTKYYGGKRAVADLTFRIEKGEVVGFLGLNGAGKSTTLRILACLILPSSGLVRVDDMNAAESAHEIRKRLGFLPDTPPLYDEMSVSGYLRFVAELKAVPSNKLASRVGEALETCGLVGVKQDPISTLSHGYRQRLGIAQAVVHKPSLLILDEPTSGLDPVQIAEMRQLIRRLGGEHTVLLSSHILTEISQTCDRLLVIHQGKLVADGTEESLSQHAGTGEQRTIDVEIESSQGDLSAKAKQICERIPGVIMVRPGKLEGQRLSLELVTSGDQRALVAKGIVEAGLGLLRLDQKAFGLESVFNRLVNPTGGAGASPTR